MSCRPCKLSHNGTNISLDLLSLHELNIYIPENFEVYPKMIEFGKTVRDVETFRW